MILNDFGGEPPAVLMQNHLLPIIYIINTFFGVKKNKTNLPI